MITILRFSITPGNVLYISLKLTSEFRGAIVVLSRYIILYAQPSQSNRAVRYRLRRRHLKYITGRHRRINSVFRT